MIRRRIEKPKLTLILKNNTGNELPVQLFLPDNPNNMANQGQTYHANLAGQTFSARSYLQWRTKGSTGPYTLSVLTLSQLNIDGLVDALNALNIGSFWKSSATTIDAGSSENEFNFLTIGAPLFITQISVTGTVMILVESFALPFPQGYIDWGDGSSPQALSASVQENTLTHIYKGSGLYDITLITGSPEQIEKIDASSDFLITVTNLSQFALMDRLLLTDNNLSAVDISGNPLLNSVELQNNKLSTAQVNAALIALDGFGLHNGDFHSNGQTPAAPPSGAGAAAKISLQGKGWTVVTD